MLWFAIFLGFLKLQFQRFFNEFSEFEFFSEAPDWYAIGNTLIMKMMETDSNFNGSFSRPINAIRCFSKTPDS
jgi:hypothetical protein